MGRRRRRRRRGGLFRRRRRGGLFRRRRRRGSRRAPAPPKKQQVVNVKSSPASISLPYGNSSKLSSKELTMLMKENCMGRFTVAGNDGNLLLDTSKDSRIGMKWYPGEYRVTIKEVGNPKGNYGTTLFNIVEEGQATIEYKPAETVVQTFGTAPVQSFPKVEPPKPLPPSPKMPPPPLPKFNQPDNTSAPLGKRRGTWKVVVPKTTRTDYHIIPPNRKLPYNNEHIFRIVPYEKAPNYLWIKRFLGNPDVYEGFGNDIVVQTPSPPLGIERGDHIFLAQVDGEDTVWRSYEGVAKYFLSKKPRKGYLLMTDFKVNDISDVPIIREDFERNMPDLPKGYSGGKAGEVDLSLYDSVEDVVFGNRGDKGIAGEVPVSPNVRKWALPDTYQHPIMFNLDQEEIYGAEQLGLSGTAGSADEWDYLIGTAKDVDEKKAYRRFSNRHPKRIFRRILRQQDSTIRKIELRRGKLPRSVKRNIKRNLVKKRMRTRIGFRFNHRNRFIRKRKRFGGFQFGVKRNISRRPRNKIKWPGGRNPFGRRRRNKWFR